MKKIYVTGIILVLLMLMSAMPSSILANPVSNTKYAITPASDESCEYQDFSDVTSSFADVTVYGDDFEITQQLSSDVYLTEAIKRYIVLLLDTTGKKEIVLADGTIYIDSSFEKVQSAALNFIKQILYQSGDNHVAVVGFGDRIDSSSGFSQNIEVLEKAIEELKIYPPDDDIGVNTGAALLKADELLSSVEEPGVVIKNIIYFSGWIPTEGTCDSVRSNYPASEGYYTLATYNYVRVSDRSYVIDYANPALKIAKGLKDKDYNIYTISCFQSNIKDNSPTYNFAKLFMGDISCNKGSFYEAENPDDLYYAFGAVIEDIWGTLWWQEYSYETIWRNWGGFGYDTENMWKQNKPERYGHLGVDLIQPEGDSVAKDKDVVAVTRGDIIFAGYDDANGNVVLIKHEIENGGIFYSVYFHMKTREYTVDVTKDDKPIPVRCGQKLGVWGGTGTSAGGAVHLHMAIYELTDLNGNPPYVGGSQKGWFDSSFTKTDFDKGYKDYSASYDSVKYTFRFYDPLQIIKGQSSFVSMSNYTKAIYIACPVDVNVYDSQNNLVSSVVNNEVVENILPTLIIDDVKEIHLAQGHNYRIEIIATEEGIMDYSIEEMYRKVMLNDISLTKGEIFTGYVNTEKDAPSEVYELTSSKGQKYYATEDLTGNDFKNIDITISTIGDKTTSSTGKATKGDYIVINARDYYGGDDYYGLEDWEFEGWYENGVRIDGAEERYSFYASVNRELTARYVQKEVFIRRISLVTLGDGSVSGNGFFEKDSVVTVKAIPDAGYIFDGWYSTEGKISDDAMYSFMLTENTMLEAQFKRNPFGIKINDISIGNNQANIDFDIISANGKGYSVYLSISEDEGTFKFYADVNYNSKGVHIKGLTNGETYCAYITYTDAGVTIRSNVIKFTL
jgi:murein DD-endopeptidase MepM/ murein hydrolase activator NlpD